MLIWCSFEMWNNHRAGWSRPGTLWFDALLKCETICVVLLLAAALLWFDALLKCETIRCRRKTTTTALWFDALLKCETISSTPTCWPCGCDLMLFWNVKQYPRAQALPHARCDLMLFWNVKQSLLSFEYTLSVVIWCSFEMWNNSLTQTARDRAVVIWCSFEMWNNERDGVCAKAGVVIWCSFEMWNNLRTSTPPRQQLWFDALLKCETM